MLEGLKARFGGEKQAIEALRAKFPQMNQKTLARRIRDNDFNIPENKALAAKASTRTLLSIYSVIRRYDKKVGLKTAAAINAEIDNIAAAATNTLTKGQLVTA